MYFQYATSYCNVFVFFSLEKLEISNFKYLYKWILQNLLMFNIYPINSTH